MLLRVPKALKVLHLVLQDIQLREKMEIETERLDICSLNQ